MSMGDLDALSMVREMLWVGVSVGEGDSVVAPSGSDGASDNEAVSDCVRVSFLFFL